MFRGCIVPGLARADGGDADRKRFTGPEWIFERKLDGIRLLAFKNGRDVRLFSRNRLPQNATYPAIVDAVAALPRARR